MSSRSVIFLRGFCGGELFGPLLLGAAGANLSVRILISLLMVVASAFTRADKLVGLVEALLDRLSVLIKSRDHGLEPEVDVVELVLEVIDLALDPLERVEHLAFQPYDADVLGDGPRGGRSIVLVPHAHLPHGEKDERARWSFADVSLAAEMSLFLNVRRERAYVSLGGKKLCDINERLGMF